MVKKFSGGDLYLTYPGSDKVVVNPPREKCEVLDYWPAPER